MQTGGPYNPGCLVYILKIFVDATFLYLFTQSRGKH